MFLRVRARIEIKYDTLEISEDVEYFCKGKKPVFFGRAHFSIWRNKTRDRKRRQRMILINLSFIHAFSKSHAMNGDDGSGETSQNHLKEYSLI